ncbi:MULTISPECIES: hypothetical protein [unclassified Sphingobium]|uniref:hypothetical protein n=1 Tax=unclassified Sphingobium TaxID=2611147 RepID=UPI00222551AF|nr:MULTISPECIES: hypothetical protein [unclassified Sphingobium]MCW2410244.1 cell wall assembly regulator SMI1 [Sphingobium sp. B8D3D]MCW2414064.1 cell wall assembly regulator SMI1 [Sphingobium sp. B8D3A]
MSKRELTQNERRQFHLGCAALLLILAFGLVRSAGSAMCDTTTFYESLSPDGWTGARVQMTDCGALSGFSRVVWIQPRWLPTDRLFACRAVAIDGQPAVRLEWAQATLIVVTDAPRASVIHANASCYGWSVKLAAPHS